MLTVKVSGRFVSQRQVQEKLLAESDDWELSEAEKVLEMIYAENDDLNGSRGLQAAERPDISEERYVLSDNKAYLLES